MRVENKYRHAEGTADTGKTGKNGQIWSDIFNNLGDWLNGAGNLTDAIKGNPKSPDTVVYQTGGSQNMGAILGIGAAIVVVVIILVFALKK